MISIQPSRWSFLSLPPSSSSLTFPFFFIEFFVLRSVCVVVACRAVRWH
jgi:hypothetical protein